MLYVMIVFRDAMLFKNPQNTKTAPGVRAEPLFMLDVKLRYRQPMYVYQ